MKIEEKLTPEQEKRRHEMEVFALELGIAGNVKLAEHIRDQDRAIDMLCGLVGMLVNDVKGHSWKD